MVEIKHEAGSSSGEQTPHTADESKYRLVYSKSKVYVNPTAYARDNIPGFVTLVKRVRASSTMFGYDLIERAGGCEPDVSPRMDSREPAQREGSERVGQIHSHRREHRSGR